MRMLCRILFVLVLSGPLLTASAYAQQGLMVTCIKTRLPKPDGMGLKASDADNLILKIGSKIGLGTGGIKIFECDFLENAAAYYSDGTNPDVPQGEYIAFKPKWIREVAGDDRSQVYGILGHELGHLVGRHFFQPNISKHDKELEADGFAGCSVAMMNGNWASLRSLLQRIRGEIPGEYPSVDQSLEVASSKFAECGGDLGGEIGWIYVGLNVDGDWRTNIFEDAASLSPEDLVDQELTTVKGSNVRSGPFKATKQLDGGGCDHKETKIVDGLSAKSKVLVKEIYRLEGDWCKNFVWAHIYESR